MQREVHSLIGRSGTGKTTLLRTCLYNSTRALVYDALGNFEHGVVCRTQAEVKRYLERNGGGKFRVIYRPRIDITDRRHAAEHVDWLCMVARWIAPVELFIDELDHCADGSEMPPQLNGLVQYGRNIGVSLRGAVRRPKVVIPRSFLTETNRFSVFRLVDPLDVAYVSDYTSFSPEEISGLGMLEFLEWRDGETAKFRLTYRDGTPTIQLVNGRAR